VEVMVFVSVFPRCRFGVLARTSYDDVILTSRNVFFGGVS
jgi:hypothetical protein